ncbi:MAG: hypothetical protein E2O39_02750 [Planctomycetota bacterium]|nr:MAG: hypothetical protein E2O39_02750 [Planctomycetota bacterium]
MDEPRGLLRILDDFWNPVLVKEVRQALRGRLFHICFSITLVGVTLVSAGMVVAMGNEVSHSEGRDFFLGLFTCLAIAVIGFVPFTAFNAMGSEWDENTFDLLVISNLRPGRIVLGKVLGALTQAMLFYSAFTPFLVLSFLLRGIDLFAVIVALGVSFVCSTGLTVLAIMLSTLSKARFARVVLLAVLAAVLVGVTSGSIVFTEQLLRFPGDLRDPEAVQAMLVFVVGVAMAASFCYCVACNMLSHAEENRSTGVRVLLTASLLVALGFMTSMMMQFRVDRSALSAMIIALLLGSLLPSMYLVTEPERLGRRVAPRVPRNRLLALLATPWLPGGGRGMLLFLLHTGGILAFCFLAHASLKGSSERMLTSGVPAVLALAVYAIVYLGLPSAIQAPFTDRPKARVIARVSIPGLLLVFLLVPALLGFFVGNYNLVNMRHVGNPEFLMERTWNSIHAHPGIWRLLAGLATLTIALNLYRMGRGIREVSQASARRAELARDSRTPESGQTEPEAADAVAES